MKSYLKVISLALAFTSAASAFAGGLNYDPNGPTIEQVKALKAKIINTIVFDVNGVNGIGITACESETGTPFIKLDQTTVDQKLFVNCIQVTTATEEALAGFRAQYPNQSKVDGIYVTSEKTGVIRPL